MANPFFSGRIPPGLADKIDAHLSTTGETRSELLIRLLRAEIGDNKIDNDADRKYDNVLSELITRVEKLEQTMNNKADNIIDRSVDNKVDNTTDHSVNNKSDNIFIGLTLHSGDDKPDNKSNLPITDNKVNNKQVSVLQENLSTIDLTPVQIADLKKIQGRVGKVAKAKIKKLSDLELVVQMGEDLILTNLGEALLARS
jgi:hypothetical protein